MIFFCLFSESFLETYSSSVLVFRGLSMIFLKVQFLVERKANFTIEQLKCKGHKKCDRLRLLKIYLSIYYRSSIYLNASVTILPFQSFSNLLFLHV